MKVCFFGLGSIGVRHLKNLLKVSREMNIQLEVHAYRSSKRKLEKSVDSLISKQIFSCSGLEEYDIVFITNPTSLHYETIKNNVIRTKHFFIEKPLFESSKYDLSKLNLKTDSIYYVACPLRYSSVIQYLGKFVAENNVFAVRSICSSYLPEWRKGRNYTKTYSAKKNMGGGVSLDLIHEIDYITHLFGFPKRSINVRGTFSDLKIDSDDLSIYVLEYTDKLVEIHLDYFGRVPRREVELYTKNDVVVGDIYNNKIKFLKKGVEKSISVNDFYVDEIKYFLEHVLRNEKTWNEIDYAYKVLKLSEGDKA